MLPEVREVFAALQAYVAAVRQGGTWSKCPPWHARGRLPRLLRARLSSGWPGAPTGDGERPVHWAPSHSLGCSS